MWRAVSLRRADERGSMAVEVVLMVPILFLFMLLVVAGGRWVSVRADMEAAARDAARAASLERTYGAAQSAAGATATAALDSFATCRMSDFGTNDNGNFEGGDIVRVEITCVVPSKHLSLLDIHQDLTMTATGSAPLDTYRRTG